MKWAIPAICICIAAICVSGQPYQAAASKAQSPQPKGQQTPTTPIHNQITDNQTQNAPNDSPKGYASPEWWLVGVGVITFFALIFQAVQTKNAAEAARDSIAELKEQRAALLRQAKATEDAVQAAQSSTRAFIAQSRPWLLIALHETGNENGSVLIYPPNFRAEEPLWCEFVIKNYGQTPAQNISARAELIISESVHAAPPLSSYCDDSTGRDRLKILPPGSAFKNTAYWGYVGVVPLQTIEDVTKEIEGKKLKWIWLRGIIEYSHPFEGGENTYKTEFSFRWIASREGCANGLDFWMASSNEADSKAT